MNDSSKQVRAKAGGQIGINGEFFEGGQFLPSATLPKREREKIERAATGREQFERGFGADNWQVPPVGKAPILRHFSTFMNQRFMDHMGFNEAELEQFAALKKMWEAGERWFDINDFPDMANFADKARIIKSQNTNL